MIASLFEVKKNIPEITVSVPEVPNMVSLRKCLRIIPVALFLCGDVFLLYPQQNLPVAEEFEIEGTALWECQCTAHACPCQKNGAPEHGTCEAADFVHIHTGRYGKLRLDGLNAVLVGNLVDKNESRLYATIYVDQIADSAQRNAITAIVQFLNGSYATSPLRAAQVRTVPMAFSESPDKTTYTLTIPGILDEKAVLHRNAYGKPISTVTAMDAWSNSEHYADNDMFHYNDANLHRSRDHSGGYANIKYFHLTKTMYDKKEMLGQYADFSGHWTREQLALIHKQGLKE
jgi:hypothetical protein